MRKCVHSCKLDHARVRARTPCKPAQRGLYHKLLIAAGPDSIAPPLQPLCPLYHMARMETSSRRTLSPDLSRLLRPPDNRSVLKVSRSHPMAPVSVHAFSLNSQSTLCTSCQLVHMLRATPGWYTSWASLLCFRGL